MVKRKCANCLYADGCIDRKVACGNFYPVDDELLNDKQIKRMIDEGLDILKVKTIRVLIISTYVFFICGSVVLKPLINHSLNLFIIK